MILNENGLTDQGMCHILRGVHEKRSLESLNISSNQMGPEAINAFSNIFEYQIRVHQISELRLSDLKFVDGASI